LFTDTAVKEVNSYWPQRSRHAHASPLAHMSRICDLLCSAQFSDPAFWRLQVQWNFCTCGGYEHDICHLTCDGYEHVWHLCMSWFWASNELPHILQVLSTCTCRDGNAVPLWCSSCSYEQQQGQAPAQEQHRGQHPGWSLAGTRCRVQVWCAAYYVVSEHVCLVCCCVTGCLLGCRRFAWK